MSINSLANDYAFAGSGLDNHGSVYDIEEGVRKHTEKLFNPILEVVQQTLLENEPVERNLEEYKGYHMKELKAWK